MKNHNLFTNKFKQIIILTLLITSLTSCSVIEQIAEYNLDRLYEEKEEVIDTTIYLPESTYVKDSIELSMINPVTLNPLEPIDYSIDQVLKLVYQPVFVLDEYSSLTLGLISEYEKISEKVYRFTIDESAYFHSGLPLEVKDVQYSFDLIKGNEFSPYHYATKYIEAITEINEKVFEVKFISLDYFNLYSLTFPVLSKEYLKSDEYDPMYPIGSGPYQYKAFQSMIRFDLTRYNNYNHENAKATNVIINIIRQQDDDYNMFLSKRIDIHNPLITLWESYSDDRKIQTYEYDSSLFYYFGLNHNNFLLDNPVGRRLVATSIPYEDITKDAFLGHLNKTVLPIQSTNNLTINMDPYLGTMNNDSYYNHLYSYDMLPTYVTQLRDDNKYMIDYVPVTLNVIYNMDDYYSKEIVNTLIEHDGPAQLVYNYVGLDSESYRQALTDKEYDLFIGIIKTGVIPDLASIYTSTGAINVGGYNSINMNGLISTYRKVNNETQFISQLENLSKVAAEELPIIPLGFLENGLFVHEFVGTGATPSNFNIYHNLEGLEIINK